MVETATTGTASTGNNNTLQQQSPLKGKSDGKHRIQADAGTGLEYEGPMLKSILKTSNFKKERELGKYLP